MVMRTFPAAAAVATTSSVSVAPSTVSGCVAGMPCSSSNLSVVLSTNLPAYFPPLPSPHATPDIQPPSGGVDIHTHPRCLPPPSQTTPASPSKSSTGSSTGMECDPTSPPSTLRTKTHRAGMCTSVMVYSYSHPAQPAIIIPALPPAVSLLAEQAASPCVTHPVPHFTVGAQFVWIHRRGPSRSYLTSSLSICSGVVIPSAIPRPDSAATSVTASIPHPLACPQVLARKPHWCR